MHTLWSVGDPQDPYSVGFAQLNEHADYFELVVHDGAESAGFKLNVEQLLDLAYTVYEELG